MNKIINSTFVSVDGVVNHMDAWHFAYIDDESSQIALEQLSAATALLMGRHTYDVYAGAWPGRGGDYPDTINNMRKYVASTTLDKADWHNTTIITDLIPAAEKLKRQDDGGDILMHGFGPVARTLIRHGMLDELHLWVHPRFAGVGGPGDMLLSQGDNTALSLMGTRTLGSGVVILSYQVAGA
ncbi:dihydrofolate reductase family protein [Nonomuraea sp. NPDC059023]|uniref:dihydrofolate reductase family protein n=1 Tax=unclassified Nonomuraea TaxID=2593643 RepID=UPI0036847930